MTREEMTPLRYCRFATPAGGRWGAIAGETIHELSAAPYAGGIRTGNTVPLAAARLLAPAEPSKIIAVGRNYADHAAEFGNQVPREPMLFLKAPSSLIGPGEFIELPTLDHRIDEEAELAVVIGQPCYRVSRDEALRYVFGYTIGNDVSDRVLQKQDGQFGRAKSFNSFTPLGPWIETDLDPHGLQIQARINGEVRQDGNTARLIFSVPFLIEFIANIMTLLPGDIILTGTPAGVSPLKPGDLVELTISGIGTLPNPVRART